MQANLLLQQAIQLHQQGSLAAAKPVYEQVLTLQSDCADALHFLGLLEHEAGDSRLALEHLQAALELKPRCAFYFVNTGNVYKDLRLGMEAEAAYQRAIDLEPNEPLAHYNLGHLYQLMGRTQEAVAQYREAVAQDAAFALAWSRLGQCLLALEAIDAAIEALRTSLQLQPGLADAHFYLGDAYGRQGDWQRSRAALEQALALAPNLAEARNNLGLACKQLGLLREAREAFLVACALRDDFADPCFNLGQLAQETCQMEEAFGWFQKAVEREPMAAQPLFCLGNFYNAVGQPETALQYLRRSLELRPDYPEAINNIGNTLLALRRDQESVQAFEQALALKPDYHEARANLGNSYKEMGLPDLAEATLKEAIRLKPDFAAAHSNLGNALFDQGKMDEAIASYRRGIELGEHDRDFIPNYLFSLNYSSRLSEREISDEHRRLCQQIYDPLTDQAMPCRNDPNPERRLRIGYVSPDFWMHPVARFMVPLLEHHDRSQVEVFAYSSRYLKDPITLQCQQRVDHWRDTFELSDAELAQLIRQDQIDILVDLTMHSRDCKPQLFAMKPAPLQVSYLAYAGTTGLKAIDYRLTDVYLDPPDAPDYCFVEKPLRLPLCWWSFQPPPGVSFPEVDPSPALRNGWVSFGSLNNFAKVSPPARELWASILAAVPHSRLLLHIKESRQREQILSFFEQRGIQRERIALIGYQDGPDYIRTYHQIDIALDPFPFAGGTTSFDALWMGVPVVTLAGDRAVGRGGVSILTTLGRPQWIAHSHEQYATIACELASDPTELAAIRGSLRHEIAASPLMDAARFSREVEQHYRAIWRNWCSQW